MPLPPAKTEAAPSHEDCPAGIPELSEGSGWSPVLSGQQAHSSDTWSRLRLALGPTEATSSRQRRAGQRCLLSAGFGFAHSLSGLSSPSVGVRQGLRDGATVPRTPGPATVPLGTI